MAQLISEESKSQEIGEAKKENKETKQSIASNESHLGAAMSDLTTRR
jgi:septation ring formation regulator EzrA